MVATGWPDEMPPQLLKSQVDVLAELVVFRYIPDEEERLVVGPVTTGAVVRGALTVGFDESETTVEAILEVRL